jgi:hypothetical protein
MKAKIWEDLNSDEFHPFCCGVGAVDTITTKVRKECARETGISRSSVQRILKGAE